MIVLVHEYIFLESIGNHDSQMTIPGWFCSYRLQCTIQMTIPGWFCSYKLHCTTQVTILGGFCSYRLHFTTQVTIPGLLLFIQGALYNTGDHPRVVSVHTGSTVQYRRPSQGCLCSYRLHCTIPVTIPGWFLFIQATLYNTGDHPRVVSVHTSYTVQYR